MFESLIESTDPIVLCIPFIAGFIGWFTNWLAVKATLYPIHFKGIPPVFGWQGVIPKNAEEMSQDFSVMIRDRLLDMDKLFAEMKSDDAEIEKLVEKVSTKVMEEFSTNIAPEAWAKAREKMREYITDLVRKNVRTVVHDIVDRLGEEAEDLLDIDQIMKDSMLEDRSLMGHLLFEIAKPEFKFIEMSGLYFGFIFGILQMFAWIAFPVSWVLPAAGFLVGYVTNWMALTLIFEPAEPIKIGPFTLQGLFIKRQGEVASEFADVVCEKVLNSKNIMASLQEEPARSKLKNILENQLKGSLDVFEKDPMVGMLVSADKLQEAREDMTKRMNDMEFNDEGPMKEFANKGSMMRDQIQSSLKVLDASEFNDVLRPVFKKDEWKLILAGGVIGVIIGTLQVVFLFGGSF